MEDIKGPARWYAGPRPFQADQTPEAAFPSWRFRFDHVKRDLLGAAAAHSPDVRAGAEALLVHLVEHVHDTLVVLGTCPLRETGRVRDSAEKSIAEAFRASSHARTTADAGAASNARSASCFGTGVACASGAAPCSRRCSRRPG